MCSLESFNIDFKDLKASETLLSFDLDDAYFEAIDGSEVRSGALHVDLSVHKTSAYYRLMFRIDGVINIPCDLCLDDMEHTVSVENMLTVKFGDEYSEEDELVTISENEGILNVAWFIYEFIALAIPIKHVHAPGKCNPAMIEALKEHSAARSSDEDAAAPIDPRWSGLLKLKD